MQVIKNKSGEILPHENLRNHNSLIGITVFQLTLKNSWYPLGNTAVDSFHTQRVISMYLIHVYILILGSQEENSHGWIRHRQQSHQYQSASQRIVIVNVKATGMVSPMAAVQQSHDWLKILYKVSSFFPSSITGGLQLKSLLQLTQWFADNNCTDICY